MSTSNKFTLDKFMYETQAGGYKNQLPISSVCNAKCIFCSNKMNPFPIYSGKFRSLADIRKGINLLDPNSAEIRLGDSLPGRISEGEALLHPDIIKIFELIREKAPASVIQITTNGVLLSKNFIDKIIPFKPLKFTIAYHSDNPENWCKILNLGKKEYEIAHSAFLYLIKNKFIIEGALVPLPELLGYSDIENTIRYFKLFTKKIIAWPPGYSFKAPVKIGNMLNTDYKELSNFFIKMRKKYKMHIDFLGDPLRPVKFFPDEVMLNAFDLGFKNIVWLISEAAFKKAGSIINNYDPFVPNNNFPVCVKNYTYKGNINCAGLLMVQDFRKALKKVVKKLKNDNISIDLIILPAVAFDKYGNDLTGENYFLLNDEFNIPVWVK
ncbi:radical SAM protein [Elusimicrobiota bacterium]